ncbi:hypothetical protein JKP88DRAFT_291662 [Tribonema minus]|uniref:VHS domain-containing protein n=1 Tax=Tribonema minus TaxID=303371 RepID=A0A835ZIX7_9STRA|nr:hypothetical protein JKP88DRAFT_291662 [Tribonema minus]
MKRRRESKPKTPEDDYERLGTLIAQATKAKQAQQAPDPDVLRSIKLIARKHDTYAVAATGMALQKLGASVSDSRLCALLILEQLFPRSSTVRQAVVKDLRSLLILTVGHDHKKQIPGPPSAAAALRAKALQLLEVWAAAYGDRHKELRAAYRYFAESRRLSFPGATAQREEQARLAERRSARRQRLLHAHFVQNDASAQLPELEQVLTQVREGMSIVKPDIFAEFQDAGGGTPPDSAAAASAVTSAAAAPAAAPPPAAPPADAGGSDDEEDDVDWEAGDDAQAAALSINAPAPQRTVQQTIAEAGLGGLTYELEVAVPARAEVDLDEVRPVAEALLESRRLLELKFAPLLARWSATLAQVIEESEERGDGAGDRAAPRRIAMDVAAAKRRVDAAVHEVGLLDLGGGGGRGGGGLSREGGEKAKARSQPPTRRSVRIRPPPAEPIDASSQAAAVTVTAVLRTTTALVRAPGATADALAALQQQRRDAARREAARIAQQRAAAAARAAAARDARDALFGAYDAAAAAAAGVAEAPGRVRALAAAAAETGRGVGDAAERLARAPGELRASAQRKVADAQRAAAAAQRFPGEVAARAAAGAAAVMAAVEATRTAAAAVYVIALDAADVLSGRRAARRKEERARAAAAREAERAARAARTAAVGAALRRLWGLPREVMVAVFGPVYEYQQAQARIEAAKAAEARAAAAAASAPALLPPPILMASPVPLIDAVTAPARRYQAAQERIESAKARESAQRGAAAPPPPPPIGISAALDLAIAPLLGIAAAFARALFAPLLEYVLAQERIDAAKRLQTAPRAASASAAAVPGGGAAAAAAAGEGAEQAAAKEVVLSA